MSESGIVRVWHADEGWGVVDSPATPGGCWTHFSGLAADLTELQDGQEVELDYEVADQDGFAYRATLVWPAGEQPAPPEVTGPKASAAASPSTSTDARLPHQAPPRWWTIQSTPPGLTRFHR